MVVRARHLRLLAALVVITAGRALAGQAQPPPQPALPPGHDLPRLRAWVDAVDRHLPGQQDIAATSVGSWSRAQLEVLLPDVKALFEPIANPDRPRFPRASRAFTQPELLALQDLAAQEAQRVVGKPVRVLAEINAADAKRIVNRLVKRGALLHMDIALFVPAAADRQTEPTARVPRPLLFPRTAVLVADGREVGATYYGAHWDAARFVLDQATPDPGQDVTVRQWYRAVAAFFASENLLAESNVHLARARQLFPDDPEINAASGRFHETYAAPRIQHFVDTSARGNMTNVVGSARSNLRQAERYFRRAVELDQNFAGARLHLGRVAALQGDHEDAADHLRRAAMSGDVLTQYFAWLFLGVEEQWLGRPERAREGFDKAAALYPLAQSPYLALSQLARRNGDRQGALSAIDRVLALPADNREDPWWTYLSGSDAEAQTLLADLRAVLYLTPEDR